METPSPLLLLLLLVLFLLQLAQVSPSTTVAISPSSSTVCVIGNDGLIHCRGLKSNYTLDPQIPFHSISGGGDSICGLTYNRTRLFCWNTRVSPPNRRRVYIGRPLSDLAVGEWHIAARNATAVMFWRERKRFRSPVEGEFESLTSGNGFTCGIQKNSRSVRCWPEGDEFENAFSNKTMESIAAGDATICGETRAGELICKGKDAGSVPSGTAPFDFFSPAVGRKHVCALRKNDSTATCWAADRNTGYTPAVNDSFLFLVAGGNLTCGLLSFNFTVVCWGTDGFLEDPKLPTALPGPCETICRYGFLEGTDNYCDGGGVCKLWHPSPSPTPSVTVSNKSNDDGIKDKLLLAFGVVGSVAGVSSIVYCIWIGLCRRKKKVHNSVQPTISAINRNSPPPAPPTSFTSSVKSASFAIGQRICRQRSGPSSVKVTDRAEEFSFLTLSLATGKFSPSARIGSGSFGSVYRGKLPDGREVAIKRCELGARRTHVRERETEYYSELAFLSRLHHKHLVSLLGFCEDGDERLLVYEHMANGSLNDHLHRLNSSPLHSSWKLRIKVLLDAARGIEYLHHYAVPPIIHRDIKPSNILIDGSWTARISDFGLSLDGETSDGGRKAGTLGYMDPEYYGLHHLTDKSDVYGFGVVMLEVLTGKKAIFKGDGGLMNVIDYAWGSVAEGDVRRVLDTKVVALGDGRELEAVELVAYTAMRCVSLVGSERPTMRDVVTNLEAALAISVGGGSGHDKLRDSASLIEESLD